MNRIIYIFWVLSDLSRVFCSGATTSPEQTTRSLPTSLAVESVVASLSAFIVPMLGIEVFL